MKKNARNLRSGPVKYVARMKQIFIILSVLILPASMVICALAFNTKGIPQIVYACATAGLLLFFFVMYGFYAMRVSMGTVLGIETTDLVVHLTTKRKVFTYDVKSGCVAVKVKKNRFICTFETQDSRDKFIFYRHAPLSRYSDGQFTEEDVERFCPAFAGEDL